MSGMIRPVQYAMALDGKKVAVEQGPHKGFAIGDTVYATEGEANRAAGRINQMAWLDRQIEEIKYGMSRLVDSADPFVGWRKDYEPQERREALVGEIIDGLFPEYGARSEYAERFADAFLQADAVFREVKSA